MTATIRPNGWARQCKTCGLAVIVLLNPDEHEPTDYESSQPPPLPDVRWKCAGCGKWVTLRG